MVSALLSTVPQAARDLFTNARLGDGTPLFSHPDMLRYFAGLARETNPAASVVPNSNQPAQAIDAEIETLKGLMGDKHSKYWHGPEADHQQRARKSVVKGKRVSGRVNLGGRRNNK